MSEERARCSICGEEHPLAAMVTAHKRPEEIPGDAEERMPEPRDWWLEDAEVQNAEHPRSFFIPPRERRHALRPGDLVRLGFEYGPHADRDGEGHVERMWVEVVEQVAEGAARGRLSNHPARLQPLAIGDVVRFAPRNVLAIDYTDEELGYAQDQWAVVDEAVADDDLAPDVVARAPGPWSADEDAWWMFRGGQELTTESAGMLTDRYPGLEEPLRANEGIWKRVDGERDQARWRRVTEDGGWQDFLRRLEARAAELRAAGSSSG